VINRLSLTLFIILLSASCTNRRNDVSVDLKYKDLNGNETFSTSKITDLDNDKTIEFDDIEAQELVLKSFKPTSVFDDENAISDIKLPEPEREIASIEGNWHIIEEGETLMLIAWQKFGDILKWKEIAKLNPDSHFQVGDKIQLPEIEKEFSFQPGGNPYLVLNGDTLGKISKKRYHTSKHWKKIWRHNKPLISNPHVIYAGFTIFTPELNKRHVASP
jgi:hypothetical protein